MAPTTSGDSLPRAALDAVDALGMPQQPFGSRTQTPNGAPAPATFDQQAQQLLEAAEMDATDTGVGNACRQLTAALRSGGGRVRPPRFSAAESQLVERMHAAHCRLQVERIESLAPRRRA